MKKNILLLKINSLKKLFEGFKEQYDFYLKQKENTFIQKTALLATQKKLEEVIEYSIKINKEILKTKNIYSISYQESFLNLENFNFDKENIKIMSELALFRNKLAHEYMILEKKDTLHYSEILLENFPDYFNQLVDYSKK